VRSACPLDCPDACSLEVTVEDGRIVRVDGATGPDANPFTDGWICKKVKGHAARVHSPERITTPLVRTGARGAGDWRVARWDEALDLVAGRMHEAIAAHGPDSVVPYLYNSSTAKLETKWLTPHLFARLGCPEVEITICAATLSAAWARGFGGMLSADPPDVAHARLALVWGTNPAVSNTHWLPHLAAMRAAGGTLVVVDPRRTGTAARADLHLAPRPGTDAILALALGGELWRTGRADEAFLAAHVDGVAPWRALAESIPLDRAAEVCDVPLAQVRELADLVAAPGPAMLRPGYGLERHRRGGSNCVAVLGLWLVAGHFGQRGSGVFLSTSGTHGVPLAARWPEGVARPARRRINMNRVARVVLGEDPWPVPVRVMYVSGSNPAVTAVDQGRMLRALARRETFLVVHEQVMTDTARLADVVLPAPTHFETTDMVASYGSYSYEIFDPVIPRVGEARTNNEVAAGLATRLGLPADEFDASPAHVAALLAPHRARAGATRAPGSTVQFRDTHPTLPGGRARLADPDGELPLPVVEGPGSAPDRAASLVPSSGRALRGALTLLSPATAQTINSVFGDTAPAPAVLSISPADAAARGIVDGARVRVGNALGSLELTAHLDAALRCGACAIPKGLWMRSLDQGATANLFVADDVNDLAGGACFNDVLVEVTPAA
jgi:anaerobic selenocysteine-containing dehydrogenase